MFSQGLLRSSAVLSEFQNGDAANNSYNDIVYGDNKIIPLYSFTSTNRDTQDIISATCHSGLKIG